MAQDPLIVRGTDGNSTVRGGNTLRGEGAPEAPAGDTPELIAVRLNSVVVRPRIKAIAT